MKLARRNLMSFSGVRLSAEKSQAGPLSSFPFLCTDTSWRIKISKEKGLQQEIVNWQISAKGVTGV